ncbi:MAG: CinA family nicotinamide mononucleotide deamidase-related protein [Candidatus Omnitrophica bacterium]|nr:CinA family nicotinamide mononucleotide deamidase-related protein [Candidatus Omnitrophota bacterium]
MTTSSRKTAVLLTVGSELLKGSTLNTNARFLGQRLLAAGFRVQEQLACDDVIPEIQGCLARALKMADLVIVSGGLGPTPDDVTREAIAGYLGKPLVTCPQQWRRIVKLYKRLGRVLPESVSCEALYPKGGTPLINRYGIALGFCLRLGPKHVVVLPGVPRELESLMDHSVLPFLRRNFFSTPAKFPLILKTVGLSEPAVMEKLGPDFFDVPFEFGIYPHPGEVTLRIYCESRKTRGHIQKKAVRALKEYIYASREVSLAQTIGNLLTAKNMRLGIAESCTGGQLSAELTAQAGASRFFQGGVIVYANKLKEKLGISKKLLAREGAVSASVAGNLAAQAAHFSGAEWGIGITGIAGPTGGTRQKPVGTVYIAVSGSRKYQKTACFEFWGTRDQIQKRAVTKALEMLWQALKVV